LPVFLGRRSRRINVSDASKICGFGVQRTLVNVGEDTALGDGDVPEELVQLLIVADGELEMAGDDTGLLVVARSVASQLENLSGEVLEDSGEVDGSAGTDTLSVVALAEETVDTANGESQTRLGRPTVEIKVSQLLWKQTRLEPETGFRETPDPRHQKTREI
jgi:hypothetical protein